MENSDRKCILFVDDEINLLQGLKRMLYPQRNIWDMMFASSGKEALQILNQHTCDIIVTDMRMPEMDGIALLEEVIKKFPNTIRFILSGQSSKSDFIKAIGPSHQFLSKPIEAESLKAAVNRALNLRKLLSDKNLKLTIKNIKSLPSLPSLYIELEHEIKSPNCSMKKIASIIEKDISMSAKVLKLINSAFFGFRKHINDPAQATVLLGLDMIQSLIFLAEIFPMQNQSNEFTIFLNNLWEHSLHVSMLAKRIALILHKDKIIADEACKAGLFHDLGKLILAMQLPEVFKRCSYLMKEKSIKHWEAEMMVIGTTHAELGAYILGLWGFSDTIVEAVAYHNRSNAGNTGSHNINLAVHVANVIVNEGTNQRSIKIEALKYDQNYLEYWQGYDYIESWREYFINEILGRQGC